MKKLAHAIFVVFGVLSTPASAAEVTAEAVRNLLVRSGFVTEIAVSAAVLDSKVAGAIDQFAGWLDAESQERVNEAFGQLLDPGLVIKAVVETRELIFSEDGLDELNTFYNSELGQQIVAHESISSTARGRNLNREEYEQIETLIEKDPVRRDLLSQVDFARYRSESEAMLSANAFLSTITGLVRGLGADETFSLKLSENVELYLIKESFDVNLEKTRLAFLEAVRQEQLVAMAYIYQPLIDADIIAYIRFLESEPARTMFRHLAKATEIAYRNYGKERLERFSDLGSELVR